MVLIKREPVLHSWTTVFFASGIKHGRKWCENIHSPQCWQEFSFPCSHHLGCCVGAASPVNYQPKGSSILDAFYTCIQHSGVIHRYFIIITLGLSANYIIVYLHLLYRDPSRCWNCISGPKRKWKSSHWFCLFFQSFQSCTSQNKTEQPWQKIWSICLLLFERNALRTGATKVLLSLTKLILGPFTGYNRTPLKI